MIAWATLRQYIVVRVFQVAVVLVNQQVNATSVVVANWTDLGLPLNASMQVRDLFAGTDNGTAAGSIAKAVGPHDVVALRLTPASV